MDGVTLLAGVIVVLGFLGIFLPALPGLLLILAGIAVWAVAQHENVAWATLVITALMAAAGMILQYVIPGRRLAEQGVPGFTIFCGAILGFIGFFVIPVAGLFIGFVAGVFGAELLRLGNSAAAWPSAKHALAAAGWSILIEFATGMIMTATWIAVMLFAM
jgi:uncharacterized protein YqgC (DUF456 family)